MGYRIKEHRCEGTFQPIAIDGDGARKFGAKWPTKAEAVEAIRFHMRKGLFPSEVEEKPVDLCHACGQPLPE